MKEGVCMLAGTLFSLPASGGRFAGFQRLTPVHRIFVARASGFSGPRSGRFVETGAIERGGLRLRTTAVGIEGKIPTAVDSRFSLSSVRSPVSGLSESRICCPSRSMTFSGAVSDRFGGTDLGAEIGPPPTGPNRQTADRGRRKTSS